MAFLDFEMMFFTEKVYFVSGLKSVISALLPIFIGVCSNPNLDFPFVKISMVFLGVNIDWSAPKALSKPIVP